MAKTKAVLLSLYNFAADSIEYLSHSGTLRPFRCKASSQARLTKKYHSIEKAFSLPKTRVGFGLTKAQELAGELERYVQRHGFDETADVTLQVLGHYLEFNATAGDSLREISSKVEQIEKYRPANPDWIARGGVMEVARSEIFAASGVDFARFAASRHSVRCFGSTPVDVEAIRQAAQIALKTPSVCNRQPWKLHLFHAPDDIRAVLLHQSGNRGIDEENRVLLVVTVDPSAYEGPQERHEAYVDGGMFAMSLVYALHSLGYGSCCLNLCQQNYQARETKRAARIPQNEVLIMMILVGTMPERLKVACSHRRTLGDVLTIHGPEIGK